MRVVPSLSTAVGRFASFLSGIQIELEISGVTLQGPPFVGKEKKKKRHMPTQVLSLLLVSEQYNTLTKIHTFMLAREEIYSAVLNLAFSFDILFY